MVQRVHKDRKDLKGQQVPLVQMVRMVWMGPQVLPEGQDQKGLLAQQARQDQKGTPVVLDKKERKETGDLAVLPVQRVGLDLLVHLDPKERLALMG